MSHRHTFPGVKPFGEKFLERRKRLGLSQAKAAKLLGVKTHSVYMWEKGRRTPLPKGEAPLTQEEILERLK